MLTADLLVAHVRGDRVRPRYLPIEGPEAEPHLARAAAVIELFRAHLDRRRGELDEALADLTCGRPDFKVDRGLAKLIEDRATFRGLSSDRAAARRARVFGLAAQARARGAFDRDVVLREAAAALAYDERDGEREGGPEGEPDAEGVPEELTPSALEASLYGDLKENEVLEALDLPTPEELLQRYALGLAQAVLLRALSLEITVREADPPRLRQLLRHVKFHGLLQEARRDEDGAVRLRLDGPLSIFASTPRYGVRMAGFLPALLLCRDWELEATVQLAKGGRRRRFRLDPSDGLVARRRDDGAWLPVLIEAFAERFAEVAPGWRIDREVPLLNLGGEVVVPDFRFVHAESGFEASLEVLGYWRRGGVARRLTALRSEGAPRLVLAVDRGLKLGKQDLAGLEGPVVPFREVPDARKVLRCLEALRAAAAPTRSKRPARRRARPRRAAAEE